jgi:hypothetical protein
MTGTSAGDLSAALNYLDTAGAAGRYGSYTIRLGADPSLPVYPGAKITLGGIPSANSYAAIKQTRIIIEGTSGATVIMPLTDALWTLLDNNTVSNGSGVAQELVKSAAPGSTEWVVPWDDDYEIELNGAAGGGNYGAGGSGGAIKGTIHLAKGAAYTINVGGAGIAAVSPATTGGFNGGGNAGPGGYGGKGAGGGGGATDMRALAGDWTTRIIVAGGGGGSAKRTDGSGGYGGGNAGNGNGGSGAKGTTGNGEEQGGNGATTTSGNANGVGGTGNGPKWTGYEPGGGGGGGYRGAAGGGSSAGGGGGSSWANTEEGMFFDVTPADNGAGAHSGDGSVRIIALMRQ